VSKNPEEVKEQIPNNIIDELVTYRKYPKYQENMKDVSLIDWYRNYGETDGGDDNSVQSDVDEINKNKGADEHEDFEIGVEEL